MGRHQQRRRPTIPLTWHSHRSAEICRGANLPSLVNGFVRRIAHGRGDWLGTELLSDNPRPAGGNGCTYCVTTSTADLSALVTSGTVRSYPGNQQQLSLRGGSRSKPETDANRNPATDSDSNTDTDPNASIERINLQWGDSIC